MTSHPTANPYGQARIDLNLASLREAYNSQEFLEAVQRLALIGEGVTRPVRQPSARRVQHLKTGAGRSRKRAFMKLTQDSRRK